MAGSAVAEGLPVAKVGPFGDEKRRTDGFLWRLTRSRAILIWGGVLLALILVAIFAPVIARYEPNKQSADLLMAPSRQHWFGTDELGRDVFTRIIFGARPRSSTIRSRTLTVSSAPIRLAAGVASASRVCSSVTVRIFSGRPSAVRSLTKSIAQTSFGAAAVR